MRNIQSFIEVAQFVSDLYAGRRVQMKPYYYPIATTSVPASSSLPFTQKINGNCDFVLIDIITNISDVSDVFLQITDSATQETLFNTPVDAGNVLNKSIGVFKRLAANSNQVLTISNQNAATAYGAGYIVLCGVNVFPMG